MKYPLLWAGAILGVALHLLGLGWDAYLHAKDSTLAGREGVFTLANPSHALIIAGLGLTAICVMGVAVLWTNERRVGGTGRLATTLRMLTVPALGAAAAGSIWLATLAEDQSAEAHAHLHAASDTAHDDSAHTIPAQVAINPASAGSAGAAADDHSHPATTAAGTTRTAQGGPHFHDGQTEVKSSPDQLMAASAFYQKVKASIAKYEDIRVAMAAGFVQVTQDLPAIAAHFYNPQFNTDGILMDPDKPENLLYSKRMDGTWKLVGAMFASEKVTDAPPTFFGPLDVWHRHEDLCFKGSNVSVTASAAECVGGNFVKFTSWEMHVWTAPGADSVFGHDFPPINPGKFAPASRPAAQEFQVRAQ
jgi:hypothetical protein